MVTPVLNVFPSPRVIKLQGNKYACALLSIYYKIDFGIFLNGPFVDVTKIYHFQTSLNRFRSAL